jgi:hypothetical protein
MVGYFTVQPLVLTLHGFLIFDLVKMGSICVEIRIGFSF